MRKTADAGVTVDGVVLKDSAVSTVTVDTGQGANELYAMDQAVQTTDNVAFNTLGVGTTSPAGVLHVKSSSGSDWTTDLAVGGTATAETFYSINEHPTDAFDDDLVTRYTTSGGFFAPGWLKYQLAEAKVVRRYRFYANDTAFFASWFPRDWTFEGSNDDSNWDVLDTQTGQSWGSDGVV